jgi:anti-sigma B factor antagonist
MSTAFTVDSARLRDTIGLVTLTGEVDIYTAPRLKETMVGLLDGGVRRLVVDLSDVTFIDSTALGVLIGGVRRANEVGGTIALVVATRPVQRILTVTGLDQVFTVHGTRDDALAGLG